MSASPPSAPKDVADILEAIARRLRSDPSFARALTREGPPAERVSVSEPTAMALEVSGPPDFGEVDVVVSDTHITVTAETLNADQSSVHVSVLERQLILCVGEGADERRHDVQLPGDVDEEAAVATFRNGVLDVVLPVRGADQTLQP